MSRPFADGECVITISKAEIAAIKQQTKAQQNCMHSNLLDFVAGFMFFLNLVIAKLR